MARLSGRVAIVTGGSRGIGEAIARRFADEGARVVIASRKLDALRETARSIGSEVVAVGAHVGEEGSAERCVEAALARWGRLDILVNNAATNPHLGPLGVVSRSQFDKIMSVNLWSPVQWTNVAVAGGLDPDYGCIINMASNVAFLYGPPVGAYSTSKAGLIHLTRQYAVELAPIRVNAIAPGVVDTQMGKGLIDQGEAVSSKWPIPRFGTPAEIASAATFLASDESSWITGQVLVVDGGASLVTDSVTIPS